MQPARRINRSIYTIQKNKESDNLSSRTDRSDRLFQYLLLVTDREPRRDASSPEESEGQWSIIQAVRRSSTPLHPGHYSLSRYKIGGRCRLSEEQSGNCGWAFRNIMTRSARRDEQLVTLGSSGFPCPVGWPVSLSLPRLSRPRIIVETPNRATR